MLSTHIHNTLLHSRLRLVPLNPATIPICNSTTRPLTLCRLRAIIYFFLVALRGRWHWLSLKLRGLQLAFTCTLQDMLTMPKREVRDDEKWISSTKSSELLCSLLLVIHFQKYSPSLQAICGLGTSWTRNHMFLPNSPRYISLPWIF